MAFIDARTLRSGHRIEADLCVIGSGAAGLAIAKHFFDSSKKVVILESGGEKLVTQTQQLYQGRSIGQLHAPLETSRLRFFGGTTNHWTAHVRPLDANDFEQRDWVPDSGWPIALDDLATYYEQARTFLRLPERPFDRAKWHPPQTKPWAFEDDRVYNLVRQVVPERNRRLGPVLRDEMAKSTNVDTVLHANVLEIQLAEGRRRVQKLDLSTLSGIRMTAHARAFVLATGGIENPRILLLSGITTHPDPRKNLVGRYFANHPATNIAEVLPGSRNPGRAFYRGLSHGDGTALPLLAPSSATQERYKLLNTSLFVNSRLIPSKSNKRRNPKFDARIASLVRGMDALETDEQVQRTVARKLSIRTITEQAPNPESRVFLDDARDHFGQRRAVLNWQLSELDTTSATEVAKIIARELGIAGLGRSRTVFPKSGFRAVDARGSFHHMGTTRMHTDPSRGVVDQNCRVHGVSNLYVAGSSVFPTTGTSNPTFTILALAFRLARHLEGKVWSGL